MFVTINPHDLTSGVVPSIVDIDIDEWSTMSSFERAKVIASRPDAAALAFDMQIRAFINVVLKHKKGPGVLSHAIVDRRKSKPASSSRSLSRRRWISRKNVCLVGKHH